LRGAEGSAGAWSNEARGPCQMREQSVLLGVRTTWSETLGLMSACAWAASCSAVPERRSSDRLELLVVAEGWVEVAREDDPFITDLDAAPSCIGPGFTLEGEWVEFDTGLCNWVTLEQAALGSVAKDQELVLSLGHYDLTSPKPAEARVALSLGSCSAWSKVLEIPQPAAVYDETFRSPCSLSAGGAVRLHLHNHGQNNWQLQRIAAWR